LAAVSLIKNDAKAYLLLLGKISSKDFAKISSKKTRTSVTTSHRKSVGKAINC
jgi:hypothetical protein